MIHARPDYEGRFIDQGAPGHPDHKIPDDEPVLLVRGQDKAAPATARAWARENDRLGGDPELSALVREHAVLIEAYQARTGRSKLADQPAQPAETTEEWSDRVSVEFARRWRRDRADARGEMSDLPTFQMPTCWWRHFFKGHKWWCRACDRETEDQMREVCEAYWTLQRVGQAAGDRPPAEREAE